MSNVGDPVTAFVLGSALSLGVVMVVWFAYTEALRKAKKVAREEADERINRHKDIYHND